MILPSIDAHTARARAAAGALTLVDLRKPAAVTDRLPGALIRDPFAFDHTDPLTRHAGPIAVFCAHGHEVSQFGAALLRVHGRDAVYVDGGYAALTAQPFAEEIAAIRAVTAGEADDIANMASIAAELIKAPRVDWAGFYRVVSPGLLKIGPYQGGHGCVSIPFDRGVCGAAARQARTQVVPDVDAFPGHIACASTTRSEIVVPVMRDGAVIAVLDLDSDRPAAFGPADAEALERMLAEIF